MRWFLRVVAVLVVAVVVAVAVALFTIDINTFKDEIAAAVEDRTGRTLTIDGEIDLSLGLTASLTVDGIRLANADWGTRPDMLRADKFAVEVAVLPLIGGELDIKRLVLSGVDVLLERDAQGVGNWQFGGGEAARLPQIAELIVEDARVAFRDPVAGRNLELTIPGARARAPGPDAPFDIDVNALWNGIDVALSGSLASPRALMERSGPLPLTLRTRLLGLEIAVDGRITEPSGTAGLDLRLEANAGSLDALRARLGKVVPAAGPLRLSMNLIGNAEAMRLDDLQLQLGDSDVAGDIRFDRGAAGLRVNATLTSRRLDLTQLLPGAGAPAEPGAPRARVFSDAPLGLQSLRLADATVTLSAAELVTRVAKLNDVAATVALADGVLLVNPMRGTLAGGVIDGALTLDAAVAVPTVSLTLNTMRLDVGRILQDTTSTDLVRGTAALDVALTGQGQSVAAIMGTLDGHARLLMGEGQLRATGFDALIGGLSEIVGGLFSHDAEWTPLNCLAADFAIADGIATNRALLIDTDKILVTGEGEINLGTEVLDLKISPRSKSPTLTISAPVRIGGTLAAPEIGVDKLGAARRVGGLVSVFVFPPAAVLGLGSLGSLGGGDNACIELASNGDDDAATAPPPPARGQSDDVTLEDATQGVKNAIEGVGNRIKGLFGR